MLDKLFLPEHINLLQLGGFGWKMSELFSHIEETMSEDFKIFAPEHY